VRTHRRRRNPYTPIVFSGLFVVLVAAGGWWYFRRPPKPATLPAPQAPAPVTPAAQKPVTIPQKPPARPVATTQPAPATAPAPKRDVKLAADEQVLIPTAPTSQPALVAARTTQPAAPTTQPSPPRAASRPIDAARQLLDTGRVIEARHALNALLKETLPEADANEVRTLLARVADESIFSRRILPDDPLIESYVVQPGDVLLNIAKKYDVPYEALMEVNGIADATKIRVDQKLKAPRGPFHVKIYKSKFRMDVYLQDLYIRSFRVALGSENGTPEGVWRVKNRLENPTYYPPGSATDKRIIAPDDPNNPLGKRWIGLEGIEGACVGHEGFGIHGTIEPDSIGKAVSLGCVRMHNEDVALLYKLLQPGKSQVTILP